MNVNVILPACPFPTLAWYHAAYARPDCSEVLIDLNENYVKQTIRNRILLVDATGELTLTLPVNRRSAVSRKMDDILFTKSMNPGLILKKLQTAYGAAPFYEHYIDGLSEIIKQLGNSGSSLLSFNIASIRWVESELGLTPLKVSEVYFNTLSDNDPNCIYDLRLKSSFSSNNWSYLRYPQVFEDRNGFIEGRSILDALLHGGPEVENWWHEKVFPKQ